MYDTEQSYEPRDMKTEPDPNEPNQLVKPVPKTIDAPEGQLWIQPPRLVTIPRFLTSKAFSIKDCCFIRFACTSRGQNRFQPIIVRESRLKSDSEPFHLGLAKADWLIKNDSGHVVFRKNG